MIKYTPLKILFNVGNFSVYSWGFMVAIAFLSTYILSIRKAKKENLNEDQITIMFIIAVITGFVGARILYSLENGFENFFYIWSGGLTWYGGFILAAISIFLYAKKNKISMRYLEIATLYLPLGHAIARIGCFLNWDDYGIATGLPWGIKVPNDVVRHPTQIYSSIINLIIFFILTRIDKKKGKNKSIKKTKKVELPTLFVIYLFLYSIARFLLGFLRESERYINLTLSQWLSLAVLAFSLIFFIMEKRNKKIP